jgi:hypothetical protein
MRKISLLSFLLLFAVYFTYAQDTSSFHRKPYILHVAVDKKNFYEEHLSAGQYVHPDNTVQLYSGEQVYLQAEVYNGIITGLRAVPEIKDSSKTITISFSQTVNKKVHEMMMLKVNNPFASMLSYKAMIYFLYHKKWVNTSSVPVPAGLAGYETWPDIIISIALGNWTLGNQ